MKKVNVHRAEIPRGENMLGLAQGLGSTGTLLNIFDFAPGDASRYHYEFDEEWLLVVDGTLVVRTPEGEQTLERGDLVFFPAGPTGAHRVMNRSESSARALMWSSRGSPPAVVVYPDSDTIGVMFDDEAKNRVFRRGDAVPWAEGDEDWYKAT